MSKRFGKLLSILLAFLLTGVLQIGSAMAVEIEATEVVTKVPNGEIILKQGEQVNFQVELGVGSGDLTGSTYSNPGYVIVDTNYNVTNKGILSGTPVSLDNTGNLLKFINNGYNKHSVNMTVSAERDAAIGTFTVPINIAIHNPLGQPGLLTNLIADTLTVKVLSRDTQAPKVEISNPENGGYYTSSNLPELSYKVSDDEDTNPTVTIPDFPRGEGTHTVEISAADSSGNVGTASVTYTIDNTIPEITLSQILEQGAWTNADVTIEALITETGSGLKEKKWARGEQSIGYFDENGIILDESFSASSNGIYTVYAKDVVGNECIKMIEIKNLDKTPPVIEVNGITDGEILGFNQKVTLNWSARDELSGISEVKGTISNGSELDTARIGGHMLTFTATDNAGNIQTVIVTYYVEYVFGGILQPVINNKSTFKLGSTIPIKFQLKDCYGSVLNTEVEKLPVLRLEKVTDTVLGTVMEPIYFNTATLGNEFIFDSVNYQYVFNLSTKGWSTGTYEIIIDLKDGSVPQRVRVSSK